MGGCHRLRPEGRVRGADGFGNFDDDHRTAQHGAAILSLQLDITIRHSGNCTCGAIDVENDLPL